MNMVGLDDQMRFKQLTEFTYPLEVHEEVIK